MMPINNIHQRVGGLTEFLKKGFYRSAASATSTKLFFPPRSASTDPLNKAELRKELQL